MKTTQQQCLPKLSPSPSERKDDQTRPRPLSLAKSSASMVKHKNTMQSLKAGITRPLSFNRSKRSYAERSNLNFSWVTSGDKKDSQPIISGDRRLRLSQKEPMMAMLKSHRTLKRKSSAAAVDTTAIPAAPMPKKMERSSPPAFTKTLNQLMASRMDPPSFQLPPDECPPPLPNLFSPPK